MADSVEPDWSHHCGDGWRASVLSATGRDICDIVGPSPRRVRDWSGMMHRLCVRSMSGVVSAVHGPAQPVRMARRGDIVVRGWALGVCRGEMAEFYGGVMVPMAQVEAAWPVDVWKGA